MEKNKLLELKNKIDKLDPSFHIRILKVLHENSIKFSENRNGIFLNMNNLNEKTINSIEKVLKYIEVQEKNLQAVETIKKELNNDYFSKANNLNKDNKGKDFNYKYNLNEQ